jgi:hypothetical protein
MPTRSMWALLQIGSRTPVGEPDAEDVEDGRHGKEVVDPEDAPLRVEIGQQPVEFDRVAEALTERLFQYHGAAGHGARRVQRGHRGREDRRRERQVRGDRSVVRDHGGQGARVGDVGPPVPPGRHHLTPADGRDIRRVPVELVGRPDAEDVVGPVLPPDAGEPEPLVQVPAGAQRSERGHQVPGGQIAGRPQNHQLLKHLPKHARPRCPAVHPGEVMSPVSCRPWLEGVTEAIERLFAWLDRRGHEPLLEHLDGTLRFEISNGERTDEWSVRTEHGNLRVSRERVDADCVVRGTRALFEDLADRRTDGITATLRGELMLDGNPEMLVLVQRIFKAPVEKADRG